MYVSTLRHVIRAMGGDLEVGAVFPDSGAVRIDQFADLGDDNPSAEAVGDRPLTHLHCRTPSRSRLASREGQEPCASPFLGDRHNRAKLKLRRHCGDRSHHLFSNGVRQHVL